MTRNKNHLTAVRVLLALSLVLMNTTAQAQQRESPTLRPPLDDSPSGSPMTLPQFEQFAFGSNPTLAQAKATIGAAEGQRLQAGLLPNPVIGAQVENFSFRYPGITPAYSGFVVQTIPLGRKLAKMRNVFQVELTQAELEASMQNIRVLNAVRSMFYQVLGAQQMLDLQTKLAENANVATKTTAELFNVGQADKPDYLESEIEQQQVEHELQAARNNYLQKWKVFAAVLGRPEMAPVRLVGNLEDGVVQLDEAQLHRQLLQESPQVKAAEAQVRRAQAVLIRAQAEWIPDLYVRGAVGYNREFVDTGGEGEPPRTGLIGAGQVGVTLPIFNRNQGGIAAARSEVTFQQREIERVRLGLRVQLATTIKDYNNALDVITRYRNVILPRAEESHQLYLSKFKSMAASYPQVLIAQRTMVQLRQKYTDALVGLHQDATQLSGFLLSGGLDMPRTQFGEAAGSTGLSGMQASAGGDIDSLDEAHNVDHY